MKNVYVTKKINFNLQFKYFYTMQDLRF